MYQYQELTPFPSFRFFAYTPPLGSTSLHRAEHVLRAEEEAGLVTAILAIDVPFA